MSLKTVVVGLDGAGMELLQPWIDAGKLPNIAQIMDTGVTADLESVLPPVTSPNWKAYATGKNPGKIGIFWWENIDTEEQRVYYPSERKHTNTEYWELLAENVRTGILGVPTTYPPKEVGEFVVAGGPDAECPGFAYPEEVEELLQSKFNYELHPTHRIEDSPQQAAEEIKSLIDSRFQAAKFLAEEHDLEFLQVTTFYINALQHFLWDDEATLEAWQLIDEHIGDLLQRADNVVLMSDHGSNYIDTVFHINTWLHNEGYLSIDTGVGEKLKTIGLTTDRLVQLAHRLNIRHTAEKLTPYWVLKHIPDQHGEFNREQKTEHVDWEQTKALASGQGLVYLNLPQGSSNYREIRAELMDKFSTMTTPDGKNVAKDIYVGEDIYQGRYRDEAPDIVIDQGEGIHISGAIGGESVFTGPRGWQGENTRIGFFAATGPVFKEGSKESISILDLAPTLLHAYDCAVPVDMDGVVRTDIFAQNSEPAQRSIKRQSSSSIKEKEIQRIRAAVNRILD